MPCLPEGICESTTTALQRYLLSDLSADVEDNQGEDPVSSLQGSAQGSTERCKALPGEQGQGEDCEHDSSKYFLTVK